MKRGFGKAITEAILKYEPTLQDGDTEAIGRSGTILATALGSVLALVLVRFGDEAYEMALDRLVKHIRESSLATVEKAETMLREDGQVR